MSETAAATATAENTETVELTAEQKAEKIAQLPDMARTMVENVNELIRRHNAACGIVRAASESNSASLVAEIRDTMMVNGVPIENAELTKLNKLRDRLSQQLEEATAKANAIAEKYMPEKATPEQVIAAQESTRGDKGSSKLIAAQRNSLKMVEELMGQSGIKLDLIPLLDKVDSLRGVRVASSGESGPAVSKPRYSQIFLNGELIQGEVQGKEGIEMRSTNNMLASEITRRCNGIKTTGTDLTIAFLKSKDLAPNEFDKVPDGVHSFQFSKEIPNSEGKIIGTKVFDVIYVKGTEHNTSEAELKSQTEKTETPDTEKSEETSAE